MEPDHWQWLYGAVLALFFGHGIWRWIAHQTEALSEVPPAGARPLAAPTQRAAPTPLQGGLERALREASEAQAYGVQGSIAQHPAIGAYAFIPNPQQFAADPRRAQAEALVQAAAASRNRGDLAACRAELQRAVLAFPQGPRAHIMLGDLARDEQKHDEALGHYVAGKACDPTAWHAIHRLIAAKLAVMATIDEDLQDLWLKWRWFASPEDRHMGVLLLERLAIAGRPHVALFSVEDDFSPPFFQPEDGQRVSPFQVRLEPLAGAPGQWALSLFGPGMHALLTTFARAPDYATLRQAVVMCVAQRFPSVA